MTKIKAFYEDEIRRCELDTSSSFPLQTLKGNLKLIFPNLLHFQDVQLQWKEGFGDLISFSADAELLYAIKLITGNGILNI